MIVKNFESFDVIDKEDVEKFVKYCINKLNLEKSYLGREYYYQSITSCVIDAVFSIGISYEQTRKAVERYNNFFNLKLYRDGKNLPDVSEQDSIDNLIKRTEKFGFDKMSTEIYKNRCRTSTHGISILKSEAVYLFAKTLNKFGINYLQDLKNFESIVELEKNIRKIPGQTSGISLDYFLMLAGDETYIKMDRMMARFMNDSVGYIPDKYMVRKIIINSITHLKGLYPNLTPRILDHQIWLYQRIKKQ